MDCLFMRGEDIPIYNTEVYICGENKSDLSKELIS